MVATVFGLLPMAVGFGTGGETNAPLARAVIGGLSVSTMLTPAHLVVSVEDDGNGLPARWSIETCEGTGLRNLRDRLTGALAEISFDVRDWADVAPGTGRIRSFLKPRDL